jgi:hypothetical protein
MTRSWSGNDSEETRAPRPLLLALLLTRSSSAGGAGSAEVRSFLDVIILHKTKMVYTFGRRFEGLYLTPSPLMGKAA